MFLKTFFTKKHLSFVLNYKSNPLISTNWNKFYRTSAVCLNRVHEPISNGPLSGIRVVDLTRVLGVDSQKLKILVIKIENPKVGDDTRTWGPPWATNKDSNDLSTPESAYFLSINRNKKSITVNLKSPDGIQIVKDLVKKSDILVENYIPGKLDKMGLGFDELSKINPQLIYASITGYGQTGPHSKRAGYDVVIEAEAGLMYITGEEDRPPAKVGVAITGLYANGAIMAALISRSKTNLGQRIDCSLIECQVASLVNIASNYLISNQEAKRMGTSHPSIVPYQVFPTKNGFIMIGAGNDKQFKILCHTIDKVEFLNDSRFTTNSDRVLHRKELISLLEQRFKDETTEHWLSLLFDKEIPFAPINNIKQTFEHPQILAREMIQEVDHPKAGKIKLTGIPVKYSREALKVRLPPPTLGQHTHEILSDLLHYTNQKIDDLKANGVI
ncbi:34324_t:CDS:2 [Gigaspora margarita]|uniref:34324_t:CDS:1 n=1 Tax=Gigaspora margarita TaxID=4874 RepID=A0ABN7USD1_GIGMA|nr:34324_t:CDS:2 [Gigaspora margarita]